MAVMAAAFTFFALKVIGKTTIAFNMIAVALWMGLAIIHAGGLEVSTTTSTQTAIDVNGTFTPYTTNSTSVFIQQGTQASWLSWVFFGFAIFAMFNVFRAMGLVNGL